MIISKFSNTRGGDGRALSQADIGANQELEVIRAENLRLQRDLTRTLEERNRLLRKLNAPETPRRARAGSRVLEQRLGETRDELDRLKQEHGSLTTRHQDAEAQLGRLRQLLRDFARRLEDLGGLVGETPAEWAETGEQEDLERIIQRFDAALEGIWRGLNEIPLAHGAPLPDGEAASEKEDANPYQEVMETLERDLRQLEKDLAQVHSEREQLKNRLAEVRVENAQLLDGNLKLKEQIKQLREMVDPDMFSFVTQGGKGGPPRESILPAWMGSWRTYAALALGLLAIPGGFWLLNALWTPGKHLETTPAPLEMARPAVIPAAPPLAPAPAASRAAPVSFMTDPLRAGGQGPTLVRLAGGAFRIGTDLYGAPEGERPARQVRVGAFALGRFEVTFDQYDAFARATGRPLPADQGWGRGRRPVINVTWEDARAYADWLSQQTGQRYRLPSEAEWEYALGAGSKTLYWWGQEFSPGQEICFNCGTPWDNRGTAPVGSARANPFGLQDMGGNVMEWVADCAAAATPCQARVVRGGAFNRPEDALRTTARRSLGADSRLPMLGFRVARELAPGR